MGYLVLFILLFVVGGIVFFLDPFGLGTLGGYVVLIAFAIGMIIWFAIVARHKDGVDKP